ncbi:hypothetical protein AHMF7605_21590 [Adhaeribacter arboris]|uniref:DUF4595 domain-containing protein n=1 Tax=Adhaeribacter arboris TaxID=2072846 RepID=A0A2T2YK78_9BACT|nr:hypothetical protein [Adhaeribacter arboris]PSR55908.1 hypothetical protein AHMF7605_21590 [Adhaeribacter arboris]
MVSNPQAEPTACRIVKLYNQKDTTSYTTYQYDSQNRLTLQTTYGQGKVKSTYAYSFNALGQMEKFTVKQKATYFYGQQELTENIVDVFTFERNTLGLITKFFKTRPIPTTGLFTDGKLEGTCEYDREGNRTRITSTYNTNMAVYNAVREYTYLNGNCMKEVIHQPGLPDIKTEYEYYLDKEEKLRDFYQTYARKYLMGPTANKNMLKKETKYDGKGQAAATLLITYEFNELGYALKNIMDYNFQNPDGVEADIFTNIAEYECQ